LQVPAPQQVQWKPQPRKAATPLYAMLDRTVRIELKARDKKNNFFFGNFEKILKKIVSLQKL
jgi:hypothetical protein